MSAVHPMNGARFAESPRAWSVASLVLLALVLAVGWLYASTLTTMLGVWSGSETFAHAYLVPFVSAWLVWRRRGELARISPRPSLWVLLPMAALALLWLVGHAMLINVVTQYTLVLLWIACVPLVAGWRVAESIAFPLGFLLFAVPFGDFLLPVMMDWTADFTVAALSITGIPVYREGLQFVIPSGNWSVVEACSGVRYLIASVMVGTLFGYLNFRSLWRRCAFVGVSILVPIVANWLRAYLIVMIGHLSDNRLAVGVDHLIYGWVFFGVVMLGMFWIGGRWAGPGGEQSVGSPTLQGGEAVGPGRYAAAALGGLVVLALGPTVDRWVAVQERTAAAPRLTMPATLAGLPVRGEVFTSPSSVGAARAQAGWSPQFEQPRARADWRYGGVGDGAAVDVHLAYFRAQDYTSKLVNSMHGVVKGDDATWNMQNAGTLALTWRGAPVEVPLAMVRRPPSVAGAQGEAVLIARLYWVDGRYAVSPTHVKFMTLQSRWAGRGDDGALLMIAVRGVDESQDAALRERLQRVLAPMLVDLDIVFGRVREQR